MRTHGACSDCAKALTCAEVIFVYRGSVGIDPHTGSLWCPVCLLLHRGHRDDAHALLDIDCRACAGAAGAATVRDALADHGINYTTIATSMYFNYLDADDVLSTAVYVAPGSRPAAPPAPTITLAPGEVRCSCNVCERLLVRA